MAYTHRIITTEIENQVKEVKAEGTGTHNQQQKEILERSSNLSERVQYLWNIHASDW